METALGGSWLYHLEAYRRLFPPAFLSTVRPGKNDYPYLTLWGQFLDRNGQVRPEPARKFMDSLEMQTTLAGILGSFPLKALYVEAPLQAFYEFYAIRYIVGVNPRFLTQFPFPKETKNIHYVK